jgi:Holliday junction resolvasome RuvABC endonuclease subunit
LKILGVDLSLTSTGLALIEDEEVIKTMAVTSKSSEDWDVRRERIRKHVLRLAEDADLIGLENYSYGSQFAKEIAGELGGINRLALIEQDTDRNIILIAPTQVKKFVALHGRSSKDEVQAEVEKKYDVELDSDDEADALGLAYTAYYCYLFENEEITKDDLEPEQYDVVKKILEK